MRAASAREAGDAGIGDRSLKGVGAAGNDFRDGSEMDAVFVAKRQVAEEVADGMDAARGQGGGALRTHAFQVFDFGGRGEDHSGFIYNTACF